MGYEFHITRAGSWPESEERPISQEEWENAARSVRSLAEDGYVQWNDIGPQKIYVLEGESATFSWRHGRIDIAGRFSAPVEFLATELAERLGANVYGDDE